MYMFSMVNAVCNCVSVGSFVVFILKILKHMSRHTHMQSPRACIHLFMSLYVQTMGPTWRAQHMLALYYNLFLFY